MAQIYIDDLGADYRPVLEKGFAWLGLHARLTAGTRVAIKPNLTFPTFRPGVMTNPDLLGELLAILTDCSCSISIVESDSGGYNRFSMDDVFTATGIRSLAQKFNARLVNLSMVDGRPIRVSAGRRQLEVPMPVPLVDATDIMFTVPVPKIHMNTGVSVSVKNQWGIIQNPAERLKLHPDFADVIYAVNKNLPPIISIVDGKFGLTRSGPMEGDAVPLNWIMLSDDLFRADYLSCQLMGIDPMSIAYLRKIFKREGIAGLNDVRLNRDPSGFIASTPFFLKRKLTDYPGLWAFHSRPLAYVAYRSPLAGLLHRLLYLFRTPFYDYNK